MTLSQPDASSISRPPLPSTEIARVFRELQGNYGSRFLNQWKTGQVTEGGSDAGVQNALRTWARALSGFADNLPAIDGALANLPEDPPSLPAFVQMCRAAAIRLNEGAPRLAHQMTPEERGRADAAAKAIRKIVVRDTRDHRQWVKGLRVRRDAGEKLLPCQHDAIIEVFGEQLAEAA